MVFFKILLVALSLLAQDMVFSDRQEPITEMDTLTFSGGKPELVLARRAMEAQGLCPADSQRSSGDAAEDSQDTDIHARALADGENREPSPSADGDLATVCF